MPTARRGARGALLRASAPPKGENRSIANPASSSRYDSTSPYMEQNETKRGAFLLFSTPKMTLFSAVSRYCLSTCAFKQFFDKSFCAPRFLPNLPEVCPFSPRVRGLAVRSKASRTRNRWFERAPRRGTRRTTLDLPASAPIAIETSIARRNLLQAVYHTLYKLMRFPRAMLMRFRGEA